MPLQLVDITNDHLFILRYNTVSAFTDTDSTTSPPLCGARHPTLVVVQKVLPVQLITRHPPYPSIPTYMFVDEIECNDNIDYPLPLLHRRVLKHEADNARVIGDLHDVEPEHLVTA